jgi:pyruvate dehydrogenase E2 component (dihydrolipoamide acetyltransferase)
LPVADGAAHLPGGSGSYTVATLTAARRRAGERLQASHRDIPAFGVSRTVDMTEPLKVVASHRADGRHVSLTALLAFAVACTLRDHRDLNAHIVDGELRLHNEINLGIAVALPDGLVVPVLRRADQLTQVDLAGRLDELVDGARSSHLTDGQMGGGTFTISNLGMLGVDEFTAIINPPEVAILAVGSLKPRPMVLDGQLCIRDQLTLMLLCDHRAVDGAAAARFLNDLTETISTGNTRRGKYETANPPQDSH